jgi:sarcosine oxidase, subunit beta
VDRTYDVIVIGAGSVGVPAAWSMARSGLKVLVVDKLASPGQGSNKAAIGGIRATHSEPAKIRICLRSREIASTWQVVYGDDIEWTTGGYAFVAYRQREADLLQGLLKTQNAQGLDIEWLDADALLSVIPALNPKVLLGGTFSVADGHCSPLLFGHAMYDQAVKEGAQFLFNEAILSIDIKDRLVQGITTDNGQYRSPIVLNAAGAWAHEIGRMVGLDHPVTPDSHAGGITEPVAPFLRPMVVDIRPTDRSSNCYFFQLATGQVVFALTPKPLHVGLDCDETSEFLPIVSRRMIELVPRLSELRVRRTWRGLYPMTPDGAPLVGWAENLKGYLMAVGMCGHGFMLGPGLGEVLDRLVRDDLTAEDQVILEGLSPTRSFGGQAALK